MKALVLAGGSGTRLRPITHTSAKQLVPVANKPVLFYGLEALAAAGVTEAGIVVGETAEEIIEAVGDGSRWGLETTYLRQEHPLGLAHAVLIAREYLADDDFVMYLGDNFIVGGISGVVDEFRRERPAAQILLTAVPNPSAFGVAELDPAGCLVSLVEKPAEPKSDLALVGVYLFTPAIHEAVRKIRPSGRGELEITDAIQWMVDERLTIRSTIISGYWKDTGNVADMLEVNRAVLETMPRHVAGEVGPECEVDGQVRIEPGARIIRSRVVGPAVIGRDCVIADSYIGPFTSISDGCRVEGSEIESSIVLRDSQIVGMRRITESLIGRHVEVRPAVAGMAHRLVLGDHSQVQISP